MKPELPQAFRTLQDVLLGAPDEVVRGVVDALRLLEVKILEALQEEREAGYNEAIEHVQDALKIKGIAFRVEIAPKEKK